MDDTIKNATKLLLSLPSRGAWIEIFNQTLNFYGAEMVAPLTGSVD